MKIRGKIVFTGVLILIIAITAVLFANPALLTGSSPTLQRSIEKKMISLPAQFNLNLKVFPKTYNIFVCMMRWNENDPLVDPALLEPEITAMQNYYKEISYGKIQFNVVGYFGNEVWQEALPTTMQEEKEAAIRACDFFVDYNTIDAMIVYPGRLFNELGVALTDGDFNTATDDGSIQIDMIRVSNDSFKCYILSHEFGHALLGGGVGDHATGLECEESSFNEHREGCREIEMANPFDIMGGATTGQDGRQKVGHMSGWSKYLTGKWAKLRTIVRDGNYSLDLLETVTSGYKVLRVPFEDNPVCIDYRKPIGYDKNFSMNTPVMQNTGKFAGIPENGCLFVEICSMTGDIFHKRLLIDSRPNSIPVPSDDAAQIDFCDACIHEGDTFNNEALGVSSLSFEEISPKTVRVFLEVDEGRIIKKPDLEVVIEAGADICHFTQGAHINIKNNSELEITKTFMIRVVGIANGEEVLIEEKRINGFDAGETLWLNYPNVAQFDSVRVNVDTTNKIDESNEANNESAMVKNCNV